MKITNPIGKRGEDLAVAYLRQKGYKILDRNFQGRQGEIDIICIDPASHSLSIHFDHTEKREQTLVFVEVKTRRSAQFGTPLEAIRHTKLSAIEITGELYKSRHKNLPNAMRIDAIAIELDEGGKVSHIEHVENIGEF